MSVEGKPFLFVHALYFSQFFHSFQNLVLELILNSWVQSAAYFFLMSGLGIISSLKKYTKNVYSINMRILKYKTQIANMRTYVNTH